MRHRFVLAVLVLLAPFVVTTSSGAATLTANAWWAYHGNGQRTGYATSMPTYTGGMHIIRRLVLDGAVYAQPIVADGLTFAATENNSIYAFDVNNKLVWKRNLGKPSPASQRPCGDIDPLGITSTPVYYSATDTLYVSAELGTSPPTHRLYAINARTGRVSFSRSLDLSGVDQTAMQQRGALTWSVGRVWVPFGALAGDCGNYKGRVVGVPLGGSGSLLSYTAPTERGGGIWAPSGPTADGKGHLFVVSANGAAFPGDPYDYTNSVLKLSSSTATRLDSFAPSDWAENNQGDVGLGSQQPALVGPWVFVAGKSGPAYVLRQDDLGGIGGEVSQINLCRSFGGTSVINDVVYVPCKDGIRAVRIDSSGGMHVLWHAANATASPVYGGGVIWSLNTAAHVLYGYSASTGALRATVTIGVLSTQFTTPAVSGRRLLIGVTHGLDVLAF